MMRFVLEALAGTVGGLVGWFVVGFLAAQLFTSIGGSREGANAMGGFFYVGPLGGIAGFVLAFWLVRKYLDRGAETAAAGNGIVSTIGALVLVVGLGSALLVLVARVMRPDSTINIAQGENASIDFEVRVPNAVLGSKPAADVISISFKAINGHDERLEPVTWSENRDRGGVTLTGSVVIRERTQEQYFVVATGGETFDVFARIPENMYKKGSWEPRLYLTRNDAAAMGDAVTITSRYLPPKR